METCKDCLHYKVCDYYEKEKALLKLTMSYRDITNDLADCCKQFKNKADVVEVVRCKDCKHYDYNQCYHKRHDEHSLAIYQNADDFCNYGERSETNAE